MRSPKKPSRLGAAGLAVLSLAALPTAVYAFDDRIEADIKHVIECLTWMINDPPRYLENCQPSRPREVMETSVTNKPRPSSSVSSSSSEEPPPPTNSSESSSSSSSSSSSEDPSSSSSSSFSQPSEEEPSCEGIQCESSFSEPPR